MKLRTLLLLVGIAAVAVPAVTPASQPVNVRVTDLSPAASPVPSDFNWLFGDLYRMGELSIVLPAGFTTLSAEIGG